MRISELSRHASVPVSTIKFYIREGLLPAGTPSARNQARYDASHLERLDLIRALQEVADLPLDVVRDVLRQVDEPFGEGDPVAAATAAIYRVPPRERSAAERAEVEKLREEITALLLELPWVLPDPGLRPHLYVDQLADSIAQTRKYFDPDYPVETLRRYAEVAWQLAGIAYEGDEDRIPEPGDDLTDATRSAVLGMLLLEKQFNALLRAALAMRSAHALAARENP